MSLPGTRAERALGQVTAALLGARVPAGHWAGELSTSALSTATAVTALATADARLHADRIEHGLRWLAGHANADGGWGDTVRSRSNLSTTALVWAAFAAARADARFPEVVRGAERWIEVQAGSLEALVPSIEAAYGTDRTFSVPILMMLALSGRLGPDGWRRVRPLPFELGMLPPRWFGAIRLPVVSYALPALIAIGQVIHHAAPTRNPFRRALRDFARPRTLDRLLTLQPGNGGFLEATPLTSFVVMSLAAMGHLEHEVTRRGVKFLVESVRPDGSWPIDTNLATWVTTLAIKALAHQPDVLASLDKNHLRQWLIGQQFRQVHPYTQAAPGGWAWTDLPGGVPDADDTAGALIALHHLEGGKPGAASVGAAAAGVRWLLDLQNGDGGIPTFCRGWGTLPFDRSAPELTAHALRAWNRWLPHLDPHSQRRMREASIRAQSYLQRSQRADGAWLPLWFGNERAADQANPVYGTACVLLGLPRDPCHLSGAPAGVAGRAVAFLLAAQNGDGGWGGALGLPSTIEETALAVQALAGEEGSAGGVERGVGWLTEAVEAGAQDAATPLGLYFARLWYYERLYPVIFAAGALGRSREHSPTSAPEPSSSPPHFPAA